VNRAIEEYGAAVRLDPGFVQPYGRIALCYALSLIWGWDLQGMSRDSQLALGFRAADRALALDSASSDGWMARGYLLGQRYPRTLDGVLPALERAITLDPRNPEAWHQYGTWLILSDRREDALAAFRRALSLEPARAITWQLLGRLTYPSLGRHREALQALDSAVVADPEFASGYTYRAFARLDAGDVAGARADADVAARLHSTHDGYMSLAPQAAAAAASGDTGRAGRILEQATAPFADRAPGVLAADVIAAAMLVAGRRESALAFLERSEPRGALLWLCLMMPGFDAVRDDPRVRRLLDESRPPGAR
jgi:tetratricopeptide (TPR) repeat protein